MTLVEHLTELRTRIIRSAFAVVIGFVICWWKGPDILQFLVDPYCDTIDPEAIIAAGGKVGECKLLVTEPTEQLNVRITTATYGGLALAIPVILWQIWQFVTPGLYPHEKKYAVPFVFSGVLLFALGVSLSYWSLPRALEFLNEIGGLEFATAFRPQPYLTFVIKMLFAFGVGFQFPIVLVFLQLAGILSIDALKSGRRYAIVGIVILVAVVTPSGDPITLMVLSVPMYLFYEFSILFGVLRARKKGVSA